MSSGRVLVVGAGVIGAWTALHLASSGWRVTLADQYPPGNTRASSGGESRTLRLAHGQDAFLTEWAVRASRMWEGLASGWHEPLLARAGASWLVPSDADGSWEESSAATLREAGVKHRVLGRTGIERLYPAVRVTGFDQALYEPGARLLYARRSVRAAVQRARELGADIIRARVRPAEGGGIDVEGAARIEAEQVVWCCGPWLGQLFGKADIRALRQDIFYLGGPHIGLSGLPLWLDRTNMVYGSGDLTGRGIKVNSDAAVEQVAVDTYHRFPAPKGLAAVRSYLATHFPDLADRPLAGSETNQYEMSPDGDFIIDRHPDVPSWWLAGGGSGQGFKHAPVIGAEVARLLSGREPSSPRFALGAPRARSSAGSVFG
ncbi:FAD-dependent oxidoreductase [Streptomyces sp. NPDC052042]|uniref:FAD-dependent oxidoreductase n=1 Tax=Streptomyces sp. NPDC052042 TaxID=3365683 RepID=UPI0037D6613D